MQERDKVMLSNELRNLSKYCDLPNSGIDIYIHVQIVQKNKISKIKMTFESKMERDLSTIKKPINAMNGIYTPSYTHYPLFLRWF